MWVGREGVGGCLVGGAVDVFRIERDARLEEVDRQGRERVVEEDVRSSEWASRGELHKMRRKRKCKPHAPYTESIG